MSVGAESVFCYVNMVTGYAFFPFVLVAVWLIFAVGGFFIQKRSVGSGDFPMSVAIAGFITSVFAVMLRLVKYDGVACLIDGTTFVVTLVVAGLGVLWFLFSRE